MGCVYAIGKRLIQLCRKGYANIILLFNDWIIYTDFETREITGFHLTAELLVEKYGYIYAGRESL